MNKKSFSASSWFGKDQPTHNRHLDRESRAQANEPKSPLAQFKREEQSQNDSFSKFFVPGWSGDSLSSHGVVELKKALSLFQKDAKNNFLKKESLSRKLQIAIFEEFISFAQFKAINCNTLDHYSTFWQELKNDDSPYKEIIEQFTDIFSFRIAVIYLLKVRFIVTLQEQTSQKFDIKSIYYPNAFLASEFKYASSFELKAKAFEQNIFSWYRPSTDLQDQLLKYKNICTGLNITEIIKTTSIASEKLLSQAGHYYSHSISHKSFGEFINSLLINFPLWLNTLQGKTHHPFKSEKSGHEIISCKFAGDYLESLGLSHWLAQDQNKKVKWEQILCPDFKCNEFENGLYLETLNELQFLTFLTQIANIQGQIPKKFVSTTVNSHLYNKTSSNSVQKSLLLADTALNNPTYDRIFINLNDFPKNNPHHYLFTQIQKQKDFLKTSGFIFVLTSKKLFAPSQKSKSEALLQDLKIEGLINLDGVDGKGEVGNYLYIFSKVNKDIPCDSVSVKHNCLHFRFNASLDTFQNFTNLTDLMQGFFKGNLGDIPPLYHSNKESARLEFYQDAIVDGRLIHSSSEDSSNVTHPLFFKQMMNLCHPLDYFFDIQSVSFENTSQYEEDLFSFSNSFSRDDAPYTIIIDQRSKNDIRLEVIKTSALEAKAYDYGHTMCSYFHIYPKWPKINVYSIKDYFESSIGKQIVNLTFNNEVRKVKGNLSKLLTPKFFIGTEDIPNNILPALSLLTSSVDRILSIYPSELEQQYQAISAMSQTLVKKYPGSLLSMVADFKRNIVGAKHKIGATNKKTALNFSNPILKTPLLLSKTYPIYPDNKEIFIEFNSDGIENVHSALGRCKKVTVEKEDFTSFGLEFYSSDQKVLTLYSDEDMVYFLDFLFSQTLEMPISRILQSVSVPKIEDLKSILSSYMSIDRSVTNIYEKIITDYDRLLSSTIFTSHSS